MTLPAKRGRFFQARKRKGPEQPVTAEAGSFDWMRDAEFKKWIDGQISVDVDRDDFPEELFYRIKAPAFPASFPRRGKAGTTGIPEYSYVYLDVGAWVGSLHGKWQSFHEKTGQGGEAYKRDFGIVCGPHVLLCTFDSTKPKAKEDVGWTNAAKGKGKAIDSIKALLKALANRPNGLGSPVVARYLLADVAGDLLPAKEADYLLHVIVGDMHVPMMDTVEQAYGGVAPFLDPEAKQKKAEAIAFDKMQEKLDRQAAVESGMPIGHIYVLPEDATQGDDGKYVRDSIGWKGRAAEDAILDPRPLPAIDAPRVRRLGRIDLGPLEYLVKQVIPSPHDADGLKKLLPVVKSLAEHHENGDIWAMRKNEAATDAVREVVDTIENWRDLQDKLGVDRDSMPKDQAERWFQYYFEGIDGTPPADIFEGAGEDFLSFTRGLADYEKANATLLPIRFCQLGDMLDYWIGFACHYVPAGAVPNGLFVDKSVKNANYVAVNPLGSPQDSKDHLYGKDMILYWGDNCLSRTKQGKMVAEALDILDAVAGSEPRRQPTFLYGNHDNYLGAWISPIYTSPGGKRKALRGRTSHSDLFGIWMEHGHQWEDGNADNKELLPLTRMLTGTNSPLGQFVTQAAFIRPAPVRAFEGAAAGLIANLSNPNAASGAVYGQRPTQLAYSADKFFDENAGFYCYAMGHTHSACLCRVIVRTQDASELVDLYRAGAKVKPPGILLSHADGDPVQGIANAHGPTSLDVEWWKVLGAEGHDWVALEDWLSAPGDRRRGLWKWVGEGKTHAKVSFVGVPPGAYVARYYVDTYDSQYFVQSRTVFVRGIAIEPPLAADDLDPKSALDERVFRLAGQKWSETVWMKYAFTPAPGTKVRLAIFKTSDMSSGNRHLEELLEKKERPYIDVDYGAQEVVSGRFPLPPNFHAYVVSQMAHVKDHAGFTVAIMNWRDGFGGWGVESQAPFTVMPAKKKK